MINNLFFNLIVAHILGDFYLQWGSSCKNKVLYSVKGKDLWLLLGNRNTLMVRHMGL